MKIAGSICAFINFKQAARFGHIGWGFQLENGSFYFGSSDHLWKHEWWDLPAWYRYMHVPASGDIDWWAQTGTREEMLADMKNGRHIRYHAFKEIRLNASDAESALAQAESLRLNGWNLYRNNCVHQAYLVFDRYSNAHDLPSPFKDPLNLVPKTWFARINAPAVVL